LASLRNNQDAILDLPSSRKPECLVILLYASHHVSGYIRETVVLEEERVVSNLMLQETLEGAIRKRLDIEVERILDSWPQDGNGVDDRFFYEALWKRWDIGDAQGSRSSGKPFKLLSGPE
jgi:hypothetical protein